VSGIREILFAEARTFRFGAVYFRKSNPPRGDWERDYAVAAADGHTLFRHWVPWNAVEVAPGKYDWDDYDRHLDLAAKHGIRTVLAEMIVDAPDWLIRRLPRCRIEDRRGRKRDSEMHVSCAVGGDFVLCLDWPEVADRAERFLAAMARRYRGHPGLFGYDIWNECSHYTPDRLCFCAATQRAFRAWLKARHKDPREVARRWRRYGIASWEDAELPRYVALYPDFLDAARFQVEHAFRWMRWRADVLKRHDPGHPVAAHGNGRTHADLVPCAGDDFRAAEAVDLFGYTWWFGNRVPHLLSADLTRSAARGRVVWRAEAVGGPEWTNRSPGVPKPEKDAPGDPGYIRLDCLESMACGARAFQNPRWRPLLDGPLFGAYGWYGMDGSRTERSVEVAGLARWAREAASAGLFRSGPVLGDVAILVLEDSQAHAWAMHGSTDGYARTVEGAHRAFLDAGVQADFVLPAHLSDYRIVYAPYPVALADGTAEGILGWVRDGGHLVAEACLGYFDEAAHAHPRQPNRGFAEAAGCTGASVSFGADRHEELSIRVRGGRLPAGWYRQSYDPRGATAAGWFDDGSVAIVERGHGKGSITLVGSMPGYGYARRPTEAARRWFGRLACRGGRTPAVAAAWSPSRGPGTPLVRLWDGEGGRYLWVVNPRLSPVSVTVSVRAFPFSAAKPVRGARPRILPGGRLRVGVPPRDAAVLRLVA